jgi:hypothetical protein
MNPIHEVFASLDALPVYDPRIVQGGTGLPRQTRGPAPRVPTIHHGGTGDAEKTLSSQ